MEIYISSFQTALAVIQDELVYDKYQSEKIESQILQIYLYNA